MSNKKPEALRLAEHLEAFRSFPDDIAAAEELRRLHEVNQELLDALEKCQKELSAWMRCYCEDTATQGAISQASAAITKATGSEA